MSKNATFYDLSRMCKTIGKCNECSLSAGNNGTVDNCGVLIFDFPNKASEIVLKWVKENPVKTNKEKIMEIFPNAGFGDYQFCPKALDSSFVCDSSLYCDVCRKKFLDSEYKEMQK